VKVKKEAKAGERKTTSEDKNPGLPAGSE
jgi:hypothetical protein